MRKYHNGPYEVRCGFCGGIGHNIRSCLKVQEAANDNENIKWDKSHVIVAQNEMAKRNQLKKKPRPHRKKTRCGFCEGKKHNRKNCPKMKKMTKQISLANKRWRAAFVKRINTLGIAGGALVETSGVPIQIFSSGFVLGRGAKQKYIGVVKPFDFDILNVFCNFQGSYDYRSSADVAVKISTEVGFIDVSVGSFIGEDLFYKSAYFKYYNKIKILAPSLLGDVEDWINDENIPEVDWLLKNHSFSDLKDLGIINLIEKWT